MENSIYPDVIADRYELREMISQGGMSAVFRCLDTEINAECAIKLLSLEEILSEEGRKRFEHECQMLMHFDHPNIIHNLDYGIYQDIPYLVMELCADDEGRAFTLKQLQAQSPNGCLDLPTMEILLPQILQGMALFHQHGLVHRDIKPENILLQRLDGGNLIPKIIDFGLVAVTVDIEIRERMQLSLAMQKQSESSAKLVGTLNYMSPEQMAGQGVDARSDVYSLGLMIFRLLTGKVNAQDEYEALLDLNPPEWMTRLIDRSLHLSPPMRPKDGQEMLAFLPDDLQTLSLVPKNLDRDAPTVHQLRESANTILLNEPIGGRYQLLEELDRTPSTSSYLCQDLESGGMRRLTRHVCGDEGEESETVQRFLHECEFLSGVSHPNICRILDYGFDLGQAFVVTESFNDAVDEVCTLREYWERCPRRQLSAAQLEHIIPSLISAVAAIHANGLLHKDINPDNVLLVPESREKLVPKLANFGALVMSNQDGTRHMPRYSVNHSSKNRQEEESALIGTYEYMSPEQLEGREMTQQSDVYSLGLLIYRLATGFERLGFQLPSEVNPELPNWIDEMAKLSLEDIPEARAASAKALLARVPEELQSGQTTLIDIPVDAGTQTERDESLPPTEADLPAEPIIPRAMPVEEPPPSDEIPKAKPVGELIPMAKPVEPPEEDIPEDKPVQEIIPRAEPVYETNAEGVPSDTMATHAEVPRIHLRAPEEDIVNTQSISLSPADLRNHAIEPRIPKAKAVERIEEPADAETPGSEPDAHLAPVASEPPIVPVVVAPVRMKRRKKQKRPNALIALQRIAPIILVLCGIAIATLVSLSLFSYIRGGTSQEAFAGGEGKRLRACKREISNAKAYMRAKEFAQAKTAAERALEYSAGFPVWEDEANKLLVQATNSLLYHKHRETRRPILPAPQPTIADKLKKPAPIEEPTKPVEPPEPKPVAVAPPAKPKPRPQVKAVRARKAESIGMIFLPIQSGAFKMGTNTNQNPSWGPAHNVTISRPFWIGKTEVTQAEYVSIMGDNPSQDEIAADRPVDTVTWNQATFFCQQLTDREYHLGQIPDGYVYRLPTEAEWEYACRAGTTTTYSFGDSDKELTQYAVTWRNPGMRITLDHPPRDMVANKKSNQWGIFDMHGNVHEWCLDAADLIDNGPSSKSFIDGAADPISHEGELRIYRGGSVRSSPDRLSSAARFAEKPTGKAFDLGFRVVLAPEMPIPQQ